MPPLAAPAPEQLRAPGGDITVRESGVSRLRLGDSHVARSDRGARWKRHASSDGNLAFPHQAIPEGSPKGGENGPLAVNKLNLNAAHASSDVGRTRQPVLRKPPVR